MGYKPSNFASEKGRKKKRKAAQPHNYITKFMSQYTLFLIILYFGDDIYMNIHSYFYPFISLVSFNTSANCSNATSYV